MRVYISERSGVAIVRLNGVVDVNDVKVLVESVERNRDGFAGYLILDFENVTHINFKAFQLLEEALSRQSKIILSGLNDYILDIYSFVSRRGNIPIYPDWKKALGFLTAVRGKIAELSSNIAVK